MNKFITKLAVLAIGAASVMGVGDNGAVKASAAVGDVIATFNSDTVVTSGTYKAYTTADWILTYGGNNKSGGTNSNNASNCNLSSSSYSKYVGDSGVSSTASRTFAIATQNALTSIGSITFTYGGGKGSNGSGKAYLLYSTDDTTYRSITLTNTGEASQGQSVGSINTLYTFEFDTISSAYYAVIITGGASSDFRFDDIIMNFIEGGAATEKTPQDYADDFISRLTTLENNMTAESGPAVQNMKNEYAGYDEIIRGLIDAEGYSTIIGRIDAKLAQLIQEANQAAADAVIAEIAAIGDITDYTKADQIAAARRAYDALTADQKALVTNYGVLEAAEAAIEQYAPAAGEFVYGTNYGQTLGTYETQTNRAATVKITLSETPNPSRLQNNNTRVYTGESITFSIDTSATAGITSIVIDCTGSEYADVGINTESWSITPTSGEVSGNSATVVFGLAKEVVFTASAQIRISKITVNYQGPASGNLTSLISDVTGANTCTEFENAPSYRTRYNALSADEKLVFDTTEIAAEGNITCAAKLAYMEYLLEREEASAAGAASVINDPKEETPITLIVLIAVLGLSVVSAYYFINKRKQQA